MGGAGSLRSSRIPSGAPKPILQGPRRRALHPTAPERLRTRAGARPGSPGPAGADAALSPPPGFPALGLTLGVPGACERSGAPRPEIPGCAAGRPCPTNRAPKLANLAPGGARGFAQVEPDAAREEGAGARRAEPGRPGSRGAGTRPHLPGVGGGGGGEPGVRRAAAAAGAATARGRAGGRRPPPADPWQPGHSRGPHSQPARKLPARRPAHIWGSWSRPQLQHRRARGGGGEARGREGGGARRGGGERGRARARRAGGRRASGGAGTAGTQPAVTRRFSARPPPPPPAPLLAPSPPRLPARSEAETPRGGDREAPRAGSRGPRGRPPSTRPAHSWRATSEEQDPRPESTRRPRVPAVGLGAQDVAPLSVRPRVGGEAWYRGAE